ncbi:uncharacterized protein LOC119456830 [Dermacentor silvarum]|uniref:uncharacterized protein LOC119456830 n=1 Tax=Dermacentor silvarum TaxID=543639 RepID=UPI0021007DEA|nr:uncharacterized protein LOC119456830 [Dermacentor silvarum]
MTSQVTPAQLAVSQPRKPRTFHGDSFEDVEDWCAERPEALRELNRSVIREEVNKLQTPQTPTALSIVEFVGDELRQVLRDPEREPQPLRHTSTYADVLRQPAVHSSAAVATTVPYPPTPNDNVNCSARNLQCRQINYRQPTTPGCPKETDLCPDKGFFWQLLYFLEAPMVREFSGAGFAPPPSRDGATLHDKAGSIQRIASVAAEAIQAFFGHVVFHGRNEAVNDHPTTLSRLHQVVKKARTTPFPTLQRSSKCDESRRSSRATDDTGGVGQSSRRSSRSAADDERRCSEDRHHHHHQRSHPSHRRESSLAGPEACRRKGSSLLPPDVDTGSRRASKAPSLLVTDEETGQQRKPDDELDSPKRRIIIFVISSVACFILFMSVVLIAVTLTISPAIDSIGISVPHRVDKLAFPFPHPCPAGMYYLPQESDVRDNMQIYGTMMLYAAIMET